MCVFQYMQNIQNLFIDHEDQYMELHLDMTHIHGDAITTEGKQGNTGQQS